MKVYVVTCYTEGCEECGNDYHVVGVYQDAVRAVKAEDEHRNARPHLHDSIVEVTMMELQ